ncbi:probable ATP-dependent RNA helicase DDX49 isoform X1 [Paramacrobiotus metropolitanus]|uniref:probable ATP-dependent RNA helicase DDX49 isoform X1 n=1 Tax=Paramacrobiotus metropolitanus TaxID=2943436 RepID=UPI002445B241|nr:probable ATP-dependent RNA helicase DDX49 isoform X1 [Paramacrobiotus metropolitanus]
MEPAKSFLDLGLHEWLIKQCEIVGLKKPTPVQEQCIPAILAGRDCIGCAKTGSGKTAAFSLPILQKLSEDPYGIFAVVLTPTRELAHQIHEQFRALGKPLGLRLSLIIGGMSLLDQGAELSHKPHVIIATPGRLADHIRSNTSFNMKKAKFLVMDEADRLLVSSFSADLGLILGILPEKRQTLMFSATMSETLEQVKSSAMSDPFIFRIESRIATVDELDQRYVLTPAAVKDAYLVNILQDFLEKHDRSLIMVFVKTCKLCQILTLALQDLGFNCNGLHSMMKQKERLAALARFKSHSIKILISTDVGSRGLDIPKVDLVVNHNVPTVAEYPFDEELVQASLNEVELAVRQAGIKLDEEDFDERRLINKRKDAILREWEAGEEEKPTQTLGNSSKTKRNKQLKR